MTTDDLHERKREAAAPDRFYRVAVPTASEGMRNVLRNVFACDAAAPVPDDFARLLNQIH